jgi:hypothetical protein
LSKGGKTSKMGDYDVYVFLVLSIPFCLYLFPLYFSLTIILAGFALFYFLIKDSASSKKVLIGIFYFIFKFLFIIHWMNTRIIIGLDFLISMKQLHMPHLPPRTTLCGLKQILQLLYYFVFFLFQFIQLVSCGLLYNI